MKITIEPEKGEKFEKLQVEGITDYAISFRGKGKMGIPMPPAYLRFGQYEFIYQALQWQLKLIEMELSNLRIQEDGPQESEGTK